MIIAVHQPNYLPWLGFFHKLQQVDLMVLLDEVQFPRRDYCNRTKIKTPQGIKWLTLPVKSKYFSPIKEVELVNSRDNLAKHWQTIVHSYGGSEYFKIYGPQLAECYHSYYHNLVEINVKLIKLLSGWLDVNTTMVLESSLGNLMGKGNERIINICRYFGAKVYLSGQGAKAYNLPEHFQQARIKLQYQNFIHPIYKQKFGNFEAGLSAIDYLFNNGGEDPWNVVGGSATIKNV